MNGYSAGVHAIPDLQPLFELLREAGYTSEALQQSLSISYPDDVGLLNYPVAVDKARRVGDPLGLFLRLFWLERDEPASAVRRVLPDSLVQELVRLRLLRRTTDSRLRARMRIDAAGNLLFLADCRFRGWDRGALRLPDDQPVYAPSADSIMLSQIVSAPPGAHILDLCTGSGILGVQAGRTGSVDAVDVAARPVAVATLNARANGVLSFRAHRGDLYEPVRGKKFDVIVGNPPFVASPHASGPSYHAGGPTGDRVLRRITAGWQRYLLEGGRAFAISHVALRHGEALESVGARWLRGFDGRSRLIVIERGRPIDLAAAQSQFALEHGRAAYLREVELWAGHLRRHRIASIVAFLLLAERGGERHFEVVDATPRILPLPFNRSPVEYAEEWLQSSMSPR